MGTQQQSPGSAEDQNLYSANGQIARDTGARQAAAKIDETAEQRAQYHRSDHGQSLLGYMLWVHGRALTLKIVTLDRSRMGSMHLQIARDALYIFPSAHL